MESKGKTVSKLTSSVEEKIVDKIVELAQYMGEAKFYPYQTPFARRLVQSIITNEGATLSALFSRQCVAAESYIMDRDGKVMYIKDHPDAWQTKDSADCVYVIKTFGGHTITCTEEHPIATDQGWTPAQCVTTGMQVVVLDEWDKFGDGKIPYEDKTFTMSDDLAELVGFLTANIKDGEDVRIYEGHERALALLSVYFKNTKVIVYKESIKFRIDGVLKEFLKKVIKYTKFGVPESLNYFTRNQVIRFFYPLFLTHGKAYKKPNTIKIVLKGRSTLDLEYYKEHLNKLGLHGNVEQWIGWNLTFQCSSNYLKFKELFEEYLPTSYLSPYFQYRARNKHTFLGEDGEVLAYAKVHSITKVDNYPYPVWDINVPEKGWFLTSGMKVHNSGKTQVVAMVTAACMVVLPSLAERFPDNFGLFTKGFWAGCFGPVGEQAITMFDRIYTVFTSDSSKRLFIEELKMPVPAQGGARGNLIKIANKSFVRYQSGSRRAKVESKTYHLIILDEAQDLESFKVKKSILPMGAAVNATVVTTGTPDVYVGYFYDTIEQNKGDDLRNPGHQSHFEVDYTIAQKYNPMYKKYIQKEQKRLGFDSDEFKMAYRLIWPITKGMVFTKTQLEEKCYNKALKTVKEWHESPCIAGLDLGKSQDSTVVTVIKPDWFNVDEEGNMPKQLLNWLEIEGDEWEEQYPKIVDFLSHYLIDALICDSTGVGDPIRERMAILMPKVNVVPFIFSPSSKDTGYKYLLQEMNNGRMIVPAHAQVRETSRFKKFEHQLTTLKKHYSGKFLNPCPIDTDKGHDDYADSLMLAVFGTFYEAMPEVEALDNVFFYPTRDNVEQMFGSNYSRPRKGVNN
jgi:hypothetical protein